MISIALIVKNEEKHIDKCLGSLNELMKSVDSELIIVDTGSTDSTIEISKMYTNKIYSFAWINDFSAARNFAISKCSGKWLFYLDADEVLDTGIKELIDFFNSKSNIINIKSVILKRRNYINQDCEAYTENRVLRIVNLTKGHINFVGKIHEYIENVEPSVELPTIIHHYGYIGDSKTLEEKHDRNMKGLLEAYNNGDHSSRLLAHLFYSCKAEQKEQFLTEWYSLLSKPYRDIYSLSVYVALIQTLLDGGCTNDSLYYVDEYVSKYGEELSLTTMSVIALGICGLSKINNNENVINFWNVYKDLWDQYNKGNLKSTELDTCVVFFGVTKFDYYALSLIAADSAIKINKKQLAANIISNFKKDTVPKVLVEEYNKIKEAID